VQAEPTKYGSASVGSKGYCVLSVISNEKSLIVSGDFGYSSPNAKTIADSTKTFSSYLCGGLVSEGAILRPGASSSNASLSDLMWSIALSNDAYGQFGYITEITQDGNNTKLKFNALSNLRIEGQPQSNYIAEFNSENDDNALYVAGIPEIGNVLIPNFLANHIEGGSTKAIGKYTHAEGRQTIADGRYSHAEGTMTIAGGLGSHAEGQYSIARGNESHAEGLYTIAYGHGSHAEGGGQLPNST